MQKMAPPPYAARISTRYSRGATFNIVGSNHSANVDDRASNNIENGTSTARGPFPSRGAATEFSLGREPQETSGLKSESPEGATCTCGRDARTTRCP